MVAGLGLLASQAKGEITGKKASFHLDNEQADKVMNKKAALKVSAKNEEAHQSKTFNLPLR
jgi:UDP-3-O-acyl-N-acetylglucosamine deacetylase